MSEDAVKRLTNLVVVGVKPTMNYVVACLTLFNAGAPEILVRARGRHISKAVDAVEMLKRVFLKDVVVEDVTLGTEVLTDRSGRESSVSTLEIKLAKPQPSPV